MAANSNTNNRKRPFGATFRSLNDITNNTEFDDDSAIANSGSKIAVKHIEGLPNDKAAAAILRRIHSEFHTIIDRRGWNVSSITEMCCCGDGIDCLKKRKTKVMPNNVLGYNRTSTSHRGKIHDIHLRLRHPGSHDIVDYESIAATMCHELAHCVRGPHDAHFYKAMEEIEQQYSVFLTKGVVVDKDGFPIGSNDAHVLGGNGGSSSSNGTRNGALNAAESRRKKGGLTQGHYVLGGKSSSSKRKDPREAARIAAERRLLDSQYCLPCNEIIEILGDSSDEEDAEEDADDDEVEVIETGGAKRDNQNDTNLDVKPKAKPDSSSLAAESNDPGVIDLTLDDSFETNLKHPPRSKRKKQKSQSSHNYPHITSGNWDCPRCTLHNPEQILSCDACGCERPCEKTILQQAEEITKKDEIAYIKEREVQQSKETFGGFNIYGDQRQSSATLNHLT